MHANHIRISQQVMQIPQGLLIGSYQEYAYVIIVLAGFDGMQGEGGCHVLTVNEMVYLSVAIARESASTALFVGRSSKRCRGITGKSWRMAQESGRDWNSENCRNKSPPWSRKAP